MEIIYHGVTEKESEREEMRKKENVAGFSFGSTRPKTPATNLCENRKRY